MNKKLAFSDFGDICRLCLKFGKFNDYLSLKREILNVYNHITNLPIKDNDLLPKGICKECVDKLEDIKNFTENCKYNHFYLVSLAVQEQDKQLLVNTVLKVEDDEKTDITIEIVAEEEDDEDKVSNNFEEEEETRKLRRFNCKKCGKVFKNSNLLKAHTSKHYGLKPYKCKQCNKRFNIKNSLKNHKMAYHTPKTFKCSICDWSGTTKLSLTEHEVKHSLNYSPKVILRDKKWKCVQCDKLFRKKNDLHRHLRIHTGIRPFQCDICQKKFTQKSTLIRHTNAIHLNEKKPNFECYICEKTFHRKDHIESHIVNCHIKKVNGNDFVNSPTRCDNCGKELGNSAYLQQHSYYVHSVQKFKKTCKKRDVIKKDRVPSQSPSLCSVCGKFFLKHATFSQHMRRSHAPIGGAQKQKKVDKKQSKTPTSHVYQCWLCGKIKSTHCNLKVHMRTHTGEKPYQCRFCYRKFTAWNSWHDHENIHTGVKPYQCELCNKSFRQRSSLRKHLRSSVHLKS